MLTFLVVRSLTVRQTITLASIPAEFTRNKKLGLTRI